MARSTFFVAGVGTGGTITGVGEVLNRARLAREDRGRRADQQPGHHASARQASRLKPGRHTRSRGSVRWGFIPDVLNVDVIDDIVLVQDEDAMETARQLAKQEGFMCGISCGAAAWAALELGRRPENAGKLIVVILPDLGERYLSTNRLFPE